MTDEYQAKRRKKSAFIQRVDVCPQDSADGECDCYGEAWASVDAEGRLIAVSTDVAAVSQAAFKAGFWIEDQKDAA